MRAESIATAKKLAKEFIEAVNDMETEEKQRVSSDGKWHYDSPKHRGVVRRKSMDLTRSLATMRKP
jgi:uncharacterized protein YaaR (DUF327 family)